MYPNVNKSPKYKIKRDIRACNEYRLAEFVNHKEDYMKCLKYTFLILLLQIFLGADFVQAGIVISDIQVIDLGTLPGGTASSARDINDAGNIVGSSETLSGETHAFFLSGGMMSDIGTLPGGDASQANGINDVNQVVGSSNLLNSITGDTIFHGFEWQSGVIRDLGAFPPEDDINSSSQAYAINNTGLIAGNVDLVGVVWNLFDVPNYPPFPPALSITSPGPFRPAISFDINNTGQAAGTLLAGTVGFRWQAGILEPLVPLSSAMDDDAYGINEQGEIVGRGLLAPPIRYHATLWPSPSTVIDLGTLGGMNSEARDINNDTTIVGYSETATGETIAFIWQADIGMQSLGTLGGANSKAFGINSAGQIVGESETATGQVHASLWKVTFAEKIKIDVKPGNALNPINPRSKGELTVAILASEDFDASAVDVSTVRLGPDAAVPVWYRIKDADHDGDWDMVLKFKIQEAGIACGDTTVTLIGSTLADKQITGTDFIKTVGCK
jgi:probable HAF family extracellular repeat protein